MNIFEGLKATRYPPIEQTITPRDAMLYALGIGFGANPLDPDQLRYVYERDLLVFPTMAITLCYPSLGGRSDQNTVLDMRRLLHVFQSFEVVAPIPLDRPLVGQTLVTGVFDKGADRGILWTYQNRVHDRESSQLICVLNGASLSLVGGGVGGPRGEAYPKRELPSRAPDAVCETRTLPQAALLYRLSGDYNPFHVDPEIARQGGFDRPVLHGRCTFGIAGRAIVEAFCHGDGRHLPKMEARFSSPVFPGETIRTEMWRQKWSVLFRSHVPERNVVVLDQGYAELQ